MKKVIARHVDEARRCSFSVKAGLCKIGAQQPYFSVTYDDSEGSGGCGHDTILEHFPDLADIVAMHLSHDDGEPFYAVENGWYWLKLAGAGDTKAFDSFKGTLRLDDAYARAIVSWGNAIMAQYGEPHAKQRYSGWCDTQRPLWLEQARACINKYNLEVFTLEK